MEGSTSEFDPAFMTDLELSGLKRGNNILDGVHLEHSKLMEVVNCFKSKVDAMVDRQRLEFIQAYEHHVQDVQKELSYLRAKVLEIKNDRTKNEKIENLHYEQKFYKKEALRLDTEANELKKKLRLLAGNIQSIENERDWLLKKLRKTKKHFSTIKEKSKEFQIQSNNDPDSFSQGSLGTSNYSIEIDNTTKNGRTKGPGIGGRTHHTDKTMEVSRDSVLMSALPGLSLANSKMQKPKGRGPILLSSDMSRSKLAPTHGSSLPEPRSSPPRLGQLNSNKKLSSQPADLVRVEGDATASSLSRRTIGQTSSAPSFPPYSSSAPREASSKALQAAALAALVEGRAKQEELRDFVAQCSASIGRRPWSTANPRPLPQLLGECLTLLLDPQADSEERDEQRQLLAVELAATPETYFALSDLLAGKYQQLDRNEGAEAWGALEGFQREGEEEVGEGVEGGGGSGKIAFGGGMDWSDLEAVPDEFLVVRACEGLDGELGSLWGNGNGGGNNSNGTGMSQSASPAKTPGSRKSSRPKSPSLLEPDLISYLKQSESMRKFREMVEEERESERKEREEISYFKRNLFN